MTRPNIILLMTDQQRWDSLGCNGNKFVSTPNVDRLAAGGANCTNSFTPWPVCTPVRATMWTGVYPHQHQLAGDHRIGLSRRGICRVARSDAHHSRLGRVGNPRLSSRQKHDATVEG
ncbi:sulfatase-like hydrolase/transferase [Candidatus Poribacteria bacterium]|nr:sulfatase-like hydrolase/transferase [Candidatus Poribacteria bacterium]